MKAWVRNIKAQLIKPYGHENHTLEWYILSILSDKY